MGSSTYADADGEDHQKDLDPVALLLWRWQMATKQSRREGQQEGKGKRMTFYYPIPAGAAVTCMHCTNLLREHLDDHGGWRGCPAPNGGEEVVSAYPVLLVTDRRVHQEERRKIGPAFAGPLYTGMAGTVGREMMLDTILGSSVGPSAMVAGPRAAVYVVNQGARLRGQSGKTAQVFEAIQGAGANGKSAAELRKELKIKPKSLESILYRLRLAQMIRSYNAAEVRG